MDDLIEARRAVHVHVQSGAPSAYPIPAPEPPRLDPRFTFPLLVDVIEALERRGFPRPRSGQDFVYLQEALYRLLHGAAAPR